MNHIKIIEYVYSIKKFIAFAGLIFLIGIICGYVLFQYFPAETKIFYDKLAENAHKAIDVNSPISLFFYILFNNLLLSIFVLASGIIFGVLPFFELFFQGAILGIAIYVVKENVIWTKFLVRILPHGIIEIPIIIITGAIGLKIGALVFYEVF